MSADPPVRDDSRCAVCGKPRRLAGLKALYLSPATADPFCSSTCARRWHGCVLPDGTTGQHVRVTSAA